MFHRYFIRCISPNPCELNSLIKLEYLQQYHGAIKLTDKCEKKK